jgi:myo-inositol-1(or 4)-monophosphatase
VSKDERNVRAAVGSEPAELLQMATHLALREGALLLNRLHFGHLDAEDPDEEKNPEQATARGIESKSSPTDLVSDADRDAERGIREEIEMRRPEDGFLGEESGERAGSSGLRWVVDPLDGTVNYLFGIPQWCVSVAVQDRDGTLAGAIYDPVRKESFTALRGGEATLVAPPRRRIGWPPPHESERHQETLSGSRCEDLALAMLATGFAYDAGVRAAQARVLTELLPRVRDIRRFGSAALDLAWTAAGRFDAYFERSVKPWDIAAGALMCKAAGLEVVELPAQVDLPWGILVAPPALCAPLLELVGGSR